ncbi:hypothetical protein LOK49_LG07G01658 [Camellia lanceoleosa]|uniref:Uncharacterized protein n=1 Tax=Camellia lanceoleosa TaxID=1840588 RepID=A0ACC0H7S4_9ERIC|nr:hypothetical protein LOK49_LG07G01658 [Camellia lanceoleosa]
MEDSLHRVTVVVVVLGLVVVVVLGPKICQGRLIICESKHGFSRARRNDRESPTKNNAPSAPSYGQQGHQFKFGPPPLNS